MPNLVLVVNVRIKPGHGEELKPAMLENAANSVKEEHCTQFDVVVSEEAVVRTYRILHGPTRRARLLIVPTDDAISASF